MTKGSEVRTCIWRTSSRALRTLSPGGVWPGLRGQEDDEGKWQERGD